MSMATNLSSGLWNAIFDAMDRRMPSREVTFGHVLKRDVPKQLIWLEEFGDIAIPLVYFGGTFSHYDTQPSGVKQLRSDPSEVNPNFQVKVMVPRVGQLVCVLNPRGTRRFPMCVGVIQSTDYWQGEI